MQIPILQAGFPSPADDYLEASLDIQELLIKNKAATFIFHLKGDSMRPLLMPGDLLLVDRSLHAVSGDIIVAGLDGGLTVKRLHIPKNKAPTLLAENQTVLPIRVGPEQEFFIWGVVSACIRKFR